MGWFVPHPRALLVWTSPSFPSADSVGVWGGGRGREEEEEEEKEEEEEEEEEEAEGWDDDWGGIVGEEELEFEEAEGWDDERGIQSGASGGEDDVMLSLFIIL